MRSVVLVIVILGLAMGMVGCAAPATPVAAPSTGTGATATSVVMPTVAATAVVPTVAETAVATTPVATDSAATAAPATTEVATGTAATAAPAATTASGGGAAGNTAGTLAQAGQGVYNTSCALCHGQNGEGVSAPPVIGSGAGLAKYNTGQGLYDFVKKAMPLTAPGSLTDQQYLQVVTYLLVKNNDVDANATVDQSTLGQIQLK
jgi:mono/diheme cytochrome c family protein